MRNAAETCGGCKPWLHLNSSVRPVPMAPGGEGTVSVNLENFGTASLHGSMVLVEKLPPGFTAESVSIEYGPEGAWEFPDFFELCVVHPKEVRCTMSEEFVQQFMTNPYYNFEFAIAGKVGAGAQTGETTEATVTGGGAASSSVKRPITVGNTHARFGIEQYEMRAENADGSPDTQAGSHPFQLTSVIGLNQPADPFKTTEAVKDLRFNLPPGLIGNPNPFPTCSIAKIRAKARRQ